MGPQFAILSAVAGYLLGAISFTRIITHLIAPETDLENVRLLKPDGTEGGRLLTIGATTASVKLGSRVGCLIGMLDILKAWLPTIAFKAWFPDQYYFLVVALFAVIGHNWPVYYRFRGGGGMSPALGGFLAVDWLGTLVATAVGMFLGFAVVRDLVVAYVGWTWLMIPWLWIRTGNPAFAIYALSVNLAFFLALIPELRRHSESRKHGTADMQQGMEAIPMGREMLKIARLLGLLKEKKS